ncbi:unnamed protein product [Phytomonas sp. Hart1]|nr:unnamed protein product [Phytomonas sp. Hart1]|eukprot:CCW67429.1 unnamed protein product [Phytomonas sp. isolate Hart1]
MSSDTFSLIMSAPDDEATFLSLPYIDELLYWYKQSQSKIHSNYSLNEENTSTECWGASGATQISSIVRNRVEAERYFEEKYFDDSKRIQVLNNSFEAVTRPTTGSESGSVRHEKALPTSNDSKTRSNRLSSAKVPNIKPCSTSDAPVRKSELHPSPGSPSQSPLGVLWIGLFRALGFPLQVITTATDLPLASPAIPPDDLVLGRKLCDFSAYPLSPDKDTRVLGYKLRDADALRYTALVEWFEDLLGFILQWDYSCQQARCVLLSALALLRCLEGMPAEATEADVEQAVGELLTNALIVQACPVSIHVRVPQTLEEPYTEPVCDLKPISNLEHRPLNEKKTDKNQRPTLMETPESGALHAVTTMVPERTEVTRKILVGPYFSAVDVEAVLDFLVSSAVMHWRLFTFILSEPQTVDVHSTTLVLEDILPCFIPPLSEFVYEEEHNLAIEMEAVWRAASDGAEDIFNELYLRPIEDLQMQENQEWQALKVAKEAAKDETDDVELSREEYGRIERAFNLRLQKALGTGSFITSSSTQGLSCDGSSPAVIAANSVNASSSPPQSSGTPPPTGKLSRSGKLSNLHHKGLRGSLGSTLVLPCFIKQETGNDSEDSGPFVMDEVIKRVEKIEVCVEERLAESTLVRTKTAVRKK